MVLDNASLVGSGGFSDDAPDSDTDPYSSSVSSNSAVALDIKRFPQPLPILGPMLGYDGQLLSKTVQKRIEVAVKMLDRPTTEDEATAMAYWAAKQIAVSSWGVPLGIAGGAWRAYQTADTFQWPFYGKPETDTFRTLAWPSARVSLISGPRAVAAWHATRLLAYGITGGFIGQILLDSYGMSVQTVGEITDPRLKNYVEAVRKVAQSARGRLPNESQKPVKVGSVQEKDSATISRDNIREIGDNDGPDVEKYGDTKSSGRPAVIEDALTPDPNMKNPEQVVRRSRGTYSKNSSAGNPQMEKQRHSFDETFDDASPISERGIEETAAAGVSAWERIRQQASGQSAGNRGLNRSAGQAQQAPRSDQRAWRRDSQRHPREGPAPEDSIAYSRSEEERQLARDEAQKEFDARVEQERRGGNFSTDNGDQNRW